MPSSRRWRRMFRLDSGRTADMLRAIDDELDFHVQCKIDELVAGGMSADEARAVASQEFGDRGAYRADVVSIDEGIRRDERIQSVAESVWTDARRAARTLRRDASLSILAILTLSLGIGATAAVMGAVRGVLLRPLPYRDADRIVHVGERDVAKTGHGGNTSFDNFVDWQRRSHSFAAAGLFNTWQATLVGRGDPTRVRVAAVTAGIFQVFGVAPALGRAIDARDNSAHAAPVAMLSDTFWRAAFAGDSSIVGHTISLNFVSYTVVGILPSSFVPPAGLDRPVWVNFSDDTDGRAGRSKNVYARLLPGVTVDLAQREMTTIAATLAAEYPNANAGSTIVVEPVKALVIGDLARPLYALLGASILLLLIAAVNLAHLLLTRGMVRARELAVRRTLGATRRRIVQHLLAETLVLALAGTAVGLAVARFGSAWLVRLGPAAFADRPPETDVWVLVVTIALALCTTTVSGLLPAMAVTPSRDGATLRETGGSGGAPTRTRTRRLLATAQVALAIVLLGSAVLVARSFARVIDTDAGVRHDHVLTMSVYLPGTRYDGSRSTEFYANAQRELQKIPGVTLAAFTSVVPFSGNFDRISIGQLDDAPAAVGSAQPIADRYDVSPAYFAVMGIRVLRGRVFSRDDRYDAPLVCVVDEVFANRVWPGRNPIGLRMKLPGRAERATVVGVATHVKTYGLDVSSPGQVYVSNAQYPWRWMSAVLHTAGDPELAAAPAARAIHALDPEQPVADVRTIEELMEASLRARQFALVLFASFAAAATALALVGLYGGIAYASEQRRGEFAVRMALGARRADIAKTVLGEAARVVAAGGLLGGAGCLVASRLIAAMLFEATAADFGFVLLASALLGGVALLAALFPARRAVGVDLAAVMRSV